MDKNRQRSLTVILEADQSQWVQNYARQNFQSQSSVVRQALAKFMLSQHPKEKTEK